MRGRARGPWRDLPERFGPWQTVHGLFARWATYGAPRPPAADGPLEDGGGLAGRDRLHHGLDPPAGDPKGGLRNADSTVPGAGRPATSPSPATGEADHVPSWSRPAIATTAPKPKPSSD
ncbi:transposase [Streptomyces sp. NPDC085529]|uniref:transposase n=1 Tax=Streptomyces sp. NPDC085529 TaxID=3365729 RepID=UPI0037D1AB4A